jgi:two-component system, OmpR family, sensor kinase
MVAKVQRIDDQSDTVRVSDPAQNTASIAGLSRGEVKPAPWQLRSIRFQLALVFIFFLLLVIALGCFSIWRLSNFNRLSIDVAEVWLPDTRVLGDLNNFTSDFRAAEGDSLLSTDPSKIIEAESEMERLDRSLAEAERSFEKIRHDRVEEELYVRFKFQWDAYRETVNRLLALARNGRRNEAIEAYMSNSRGAYDAASDTLGRFTEQTVTNAQAASDRLAGAYRQAVWLICCAMALAGAMVATAVFYIRRSISAPLLHLARRMHRLAANDTDVAFPDTGRPDEIGEMTRAAVVFRDNAIELMRSQSVLARQAAMLEEQLAKEQQLALLQSNFVSMASHEFRTPLTIIDGHAGRMAKMKDTTTSEEIRDRAGKIRAAVLRMTHLIDNLLNSSRLMEGGTKLYFHAAEIDAAAVLHEVCQLHREMAPGLQIIEHFAKANLPVLGDQKLLFQAFSNLLSNAVKYSPGGGSIDVTAQVIADRVVVTVTDRGIGIPASDLDRLFERYHRGSNVSGIVGTGIGLHLVKMVVDLHAGSVEVASKLGQGTCFTLRLPIGSKQVPGSPTPDVMLLARSISS